jgi:hypothetical protein
MTSFYSFSRDVETVFDKLTDPDFLVERCVALGEKNIQCDVESDGRSTTVILTRTIKRDLPVVLAKIFGAENRMVMKEKWEDIGKSKIGTYVVDVQGQPVTLSAKFKLKPDDRGCEYSIDYACKTKIPLVGGKVEEFILSQTEAGMRKEMDYLASKLA